MIGGLVIGFVLGLVVGAGLVLAVRRPRPAGADAPAAAVPASLAPSPPTAALEAAPAGPHPDPGPGPGPDEPAPAAAAEPGDDEVKRAIDASAGLLDELETRYRDRAAPAGEDDEGRRPPRRRTPRSPRP